MQFDDAARMWGPPRSVDDFERDRQSRGRITLFHGGKLSTAVRAHGSLVDPRPFAPALGASA